MAEDKNSGSKEIKWYERKEVWGSILATASGILELFDNNSTAYKVGLGIGVALTAFGLRAGYQYNNLPDGLTKAFDKLPDGLTGSKGEKESN